MDAAESPNSTVHFGMIRRFLYSMNASQLNTLAALCVVIFISWQFRSMFYIGKKRDQTQLGTAQKTRSSVQMNGTSRRVSSNANVADKKRTEFVDREVKSTKACNPYWCYRNTLFRYKNGISVVPHCFPK